MIMFNKNRNKGTKTPRKTALIKETVLKTLGFKYLILFSDLKYAFSCVNERLLYGSFPKKKPLKSAPIKYKRRPAIVTIMKLAMTVLNCIFIWNLQ